MMHLMHAGLRNGKIAGKWYKKPAFRVPVRVASVKSLATLCANNTAEAHAGHN
jgi:hypothetical protein